MPAIEVTADTSGKVLWVEHEHKVAHLLGVKANNKSTSPETLRFVDCFVTTSGKQMSGGATRNSEDFKTTIRSGKCRLETEVPAGDFLSLGPEDLKGSKFLGTANVWGSATTSDCVIVATYELR